MEGKVGDEGLYTVGLNVNQYNHYGNQYEGFERKKEGERKKERREKEMEGQGERGGKERRKEGKLKLEVQDVLAIISPGTNPKSPYQRDICISILL